MRYKVISRWLLHVLDLEVARRGQAVDQDHLLLVLCLGTLSKRYMACQGQILFVWFCKPLREFKKVYSMCQGRPLVWKRHWKQLGWVHTLSGVGSQAITREDEWVSQDNSGSNMVLSGGGLSKETVASASTAV